LTIDGPSTTVDNNRLVSRKIRIYYWDNILLKQVNLLLYKDAWEK
jgi:hypothetical protein